MGNKIHFSQKYCYSFIQTAGDLLSVQKMQQHFNPLFDTLSLICLYPSQYSFPKVFFYQILSFYNIILCKNTGPIMDNRPNGPIDCSFLQVTINSNKLMGILEKMTKQVTQQGSEIKILREVIPTIKQSVALQMDVFENRFKAQQEKNNTKLREELKELKDQLERFNREFNKSRAETDRKFRQKDAQLSKMQEQKQRIQSIINLHHEQHKNIEKNLNDQALTLKQSIQKVQKQMEDTQQQTDTKFEMTLIKMQAMIKKNNIFLQNNVYNGDINDPIIRKDRSSARSRRRDKENKTVAMNTLSNWAMFSDKLAEFERRADDIAAELPLLNKMYSRKMLSQQGEKEEKENIEKSAKVEQQNEASFHADPDANLKLEKIDKVSTALQTNYQQTIQCLQFLKNKLIVQQQKLEIMGRKLQKQSQNLNQFKYTLKKVEDKKNEETQLDIIKNQIKKIYFQFGEDLDRKLYKQIFEKEKQKIMEKILILQENLTEKADKGDMKKAFLFIEEKIKQMIILIAGDQNEDKDGAIRKIPAKCLSCDKGLQGQKTTPARIQSPLTHRENESNARTITRKVRKRIQINNQNISTPNL